LSENTGKDGAGLFRLEFFNIFKRYNKTFDILEKKVLQEERLATFFIDPKSTEFSVLINQIVSYCEFLTFDPEDSYGINLDQFRDLIEKIFFKMQEYSDL
jgi:DNA polymerase III sliding clamp (beta) subunit (PCNA family)